MPGETDLDAMLRHLTVTVRPGRFTVVQADGTVALGDGVEAVLREQEGTTVVATVEAAAREGWDGSASLIGYQRAMQRSL